MFRKKAREAKKAKEFSPRECAHFEIEHSQRRESKPLGCDSIVYISSFTCRRTTEPVVDEDDANYMWSDNKVISRIVGLGWCATCPYRSLDPLQADVYDADRARAEADRVQGELELMRARAELELATGQLSPDVLDILRGPRPELPPATPPNAS